MQKRLLVPSRVRRVPRQFSWVDQRLVREHYIERCDTAALALYLFLITVADARGLSYYAEASIRRLLSWRPEPLAAAREALIHAGLIAYEAPLYQVLALDAPPATRRRCLPHYPPILAHPALPGDFDPCKRYCTKPWETPHDRLRDLLQDP
jgi:hypothetical protein